MNSKLIALVPICLCLLIGGVADGAQSKETLKGPPDFTGIWRSYRPAGGAPPRPAANAATAQAGAAAQPNNGEGAPRPAPARNWPADAPLKPEAKAKIAEYRALVAENQDNPGQFCLGTGMPGSMLGSGGYPMEIIQRPEQITVIYEAHTELRRIYLDGRKADPKDIFPSRNGFSSGHWEGDTLVVETIALKEQVDLAAAHSEQAKIIERYQLSADDKGRKVLTAEMTMTDPGFYTGPVTVTKKWSAAESDALMIYYECNEPAWLDHLEQLQAAAAKKRAAKSK